MIVAKTILAQLGGRGFVMMTGAKGFVGSSDSLTFRIGRNVKSISGVRIKLEPSDTYTVEFLRVRKSECKVLSRHEDIYADNLTELFRRETGLETRMPRMIFSGGAA